MTIYKPSLVSLTFEKPTDFGKPVTIGLSVEIDDIGRVDIELTEHQFAHILGATNINVMAAWREAKELSS